MYNCCKIPQFTTSYKKVTWTNLLQLLISVISLFCHGMIGLYLVFLQLSNHTLSWNSGSHLVLFCTLIDLDSFQMKSTTILLSLFSMVILGLTFISSLSFTVKNSATSFAVKSKKNDFFKVFSGSHNLFNACQIVFLGVSNDLTEEVLVGNSGEEIVS